MIYYSLGLLSTLANYEETWRAIVLSSGSLPIVLVHIVPVGLHRRASVTFPAMQK